jgi:hypothetical protein
VKFKGYDIYGERLRVGYCSIHPHAPYEYPCPECRNEEDDKQSQWDDYKQYCIEQRDIHDQEMLIDYVENIKYMDGGGI